MLEFNNRIIWEMCVFRKSSTVSERNSTKNKYKKNQRANFICKIRSYVLYDSILMLKWATIPLRQMFNDLHNKGSSTIIYIFWQRNSYSYCEKNCVEIQIVPQSSVRDNRYDNRDGCTSRERALPWMVFGMT